MTKSKVASYKKLLSKQKNNLSLFIFIFLLIQLNLYNLHTLCKLTETKRHKIKP